MTEVASVVREAAHPFTGDARGLDPLLDLIGDARFVLLGEATHGTHEFYQARARITRRLIEEKGFHAVAVEADWPDAYRVNRHVRGIGDGETADDALGGFVRFPAWMWRNRDVLRFVDWLRGWNDVRPAGAHRVGFYGLDLYSLHASIEAVVGYLDRVDPEAAKRARARYACFEHFGQDPQQYGYETSFGHAEPCEDEVVRQLVELHARAGDYAHRDGRVAEDEFFYAEQNARLVKDAEEYYRAMFRGRVSSWNLRDSHMADTLHALAAHLEQQAGPAKIVIWAHNSHLGDARATEMGEGGEWNVGQLVRQRYPNDSVLIGFSTYEGTVTAASEWRGDAESKPVRPGLPDSYEGLFHQVGLTDFLLPLRGNGGLSRALAGPRLERAIGVVYRPETERWSHYFHARLPQQFDAVLHYDRTQAVEPLERSSQADDEELPESFPTGI
ncbi:MAG: erythromycin esterase family protein [Armatimonadetes bacterium]|nr:erythromycin esterase family protein [Armatimonadota bacterium]